MKNLKITFNELLKEADKLKTLKRVEPITEKQKSFILHCRLGNPIVPYRKMAELWSKYWYPIDRRELNIIGLKILEEYNYKKNKKV